MTLESAIKHCEEVAEEQDKLCKRYDDASGYSRSHNESIRVTDAKKCEKCAEEHWQLAEWLTDYQRLLKSLPSVNPQKPKTGHWIVGEKYYMGERNGCCSVCEDYYTNDWFEMKYCPYCGAKMVEEPQESEDE